MSQDLLVLGILTGVGAAWLATHLALLLWTVFPNKLSPLWRVLALLPPLTPVAGWKRGSRIFPGFWLLFALSYTLLRFLL